MNLIHKSLKQLSSAIRLFFAHKNNFFSFGSWSKGNENKYLNLFKGCSRKYAPITSIKSNPGFFLSVVTFWSHGGGWWSDTVSFKLDLAFSSALFCVVELSKQSSWWLWPLVWSTHVWGRPRTADPVLLEHPKGPQGLWRILNSKPSHFLLYFI